MSESSGRGTGPKRVQDAMSGVHLKLNLAHGLVIMQVKTGG
ncbi:MAG: hypothetical protein AAGL97_05870 [Pseudomonadota bacterium]